MKENVYEKVCATVTSFPGHFRIKIKFGYQFGGKLYYIILLLIISNQIKYFISFLYQFLINKSLSVRNAASKYNLLLLAQNSTTTNPEYFILVWEWVGSLADYYKLFLLLLQLWTAWRQQFSVWEKPIAILYTRNAIWDIKETREGKGGNAEVHFSSVLLNSKTIE